MVCNLTNKSWVCLSVVVLTVEKGNGPVMPTSPEKNFLSGIKTIVLLKHEEFGEHILFLWLNILKLYVSLPFSKRMLLFRKRKPSMKL